MKLKASFTGSIAADLQREATTLGRVLQRGMKNATDGLKQELRGQVTSAGLGTKLANTWQSKTYPDDPNSTRPAGYVYSKAPDIIRAFNEGAVIHAQHATWLALPTSAAPKRGKDGKRITPLNFPEDRYGKLEYVPRKSGPAFLVVHNLRASYGRKTGFRGFKKASDRAIAKGNGVSSVIMFILVKQVTLKKRLDAEAAGARWADKLPGLIEDAYVGAKSL